MRRLWLLIPVAFVAFVLWSALRSEPIRISETRLIKDDAGVSLSGSLINQTGGPIHSVEVKVELAKSVITVEKLLRLKPGDVIPLGKDTSDPLVCRVEGVAKFLGKAGLYGANKAFLIEERIGGASS